MLIQYGKKYGRILLALGATILFLGIYLQTYSPSYTNKINRFQRSFSGMEQSLDNVLESELTKVRNKGVRENWMNLSQQSNVNVHIYRHDSLIYWNTNQLPIIRFADIHFPDQGLIHLQNGWYFAKTITKGNYLICGSFLIRKDYSIENKALINQYSKGLNLPFSTTISLAEEKGFPIYDRDGKFVFSLEVDEVQELSKFRSIVLVLLFVSSIGLWLAWLHGIKKRFRKWWWLLPILVVGLRLISIKWSWFSFMEDTDAFKPGLYGVNELFPNFLEYLINSVVIVYLLMTFRAFFHKMKKNVLNQWLSGTVFLSTSLVWFLILFFLRGLIEDSSIPLVIDQLFSLDTYSVLAMMSIGVMFYSFYLFAIRVARQCKSQGIPAHVLSVICFIVGTAYFFIEISLGDQLLFAGLFPLLFFGIMIYFAYRDQPIKQMGGGVLLLLLFSMVMAVSIHEFNSKKEKGNRELYAHQLATDKDIATEVEYSAISEKIKSDNFLKKLISNPRKIGLSDFQEGMERRIFNGFWERYELSFSLFDSTNQAMVDAGKKSANGCEELEQIIHSSGQVSEIDSNLFFIRDYQNQFSYVIRQPLIGKDSTTQATLYCTLKSKKIPEEIGFPRLLISSETNVIESLEGYSIAKYHANELITAYGNFNYPSMPEVMIPQELKGSGFFDFGEFNHYVLRKSDSDLVFLSIKNPTFIDLITSFSYLFTFFGIMLLPLLFRLNAGGQFKRTMSLAMKIQVVLILLVFLSLLSFGWGSGIFVRNQYNHYTDDVIREKLRSVETEVRAKLGDIEELSIDNDGNYMEYILQKFAKVFFTDINMYDNDGYLLATSRPKVFNIGLLSEQMNPTAYQFLKYKQKSEYVHNESIGNLNYSSAYLPFYNNYGQQTGFINLQHFGKQREFENQIQKFLVAIINVFILLLAISIVLAIFISNWLTSPLRILQESFAGVKFGKHNEQISYEKEDEIGALVKGYNQKLEELEFAAQQLAKSERESAWREMAKQVAHEIKNPLTPMKLRVQQLLRTYNPDDPKNEEKLTKVAHSIIEQIDALTKIANEFSTFAKMPLPSEEKVHLQELIRGVVEVFSTDDSIEIEIENRAGGETWLMADRNQFVRVFNNLIKNAIQAIPNERNGKIHILIESTEENQVRIELSDNGIGIDPAKRSKIFVPYFTTKSTGTGLGLAMVKQIIENHRGTIEFESNFGEGTTFNIQLPITRT